MTDKSFENIEEILKTRYLNFKISIYRSVLTIGIGGNYLKYSILNDLSKLLKTNDVDIDFSSEESTDGWGYRCKNDWIELNFNNYKL